MAKGCLVGSGAVDPAEGLHSQKKINMHYWSQQWKKNLLPSTFPFSTWQQLLLSLPFSVSLSLCLHVFLQSFSESIFCFSAFFMCVPPPPHSSFINPTQHREDLHSPAPGTFWFALFSRSFQNFPSQPALSFGETLRKNVVFLFAWSPTLLGGKNDCFC